MTAKHGNRAQTSFSGSADVLNAVQPIAPNISAVNADNVAKVYEKTNYSFLFAPNFHPGMMYANPVRRSLGLRTIFNLMGPLANPVEWAIEARVVGVAYQSLGPVFAEALKHAGAKKALVVCGEEDMDEISCAGRTLCWMLKETTPGGEVEIEHFLVQPSDFGVSAHPLDTVSPEKEPAENAEILSRILHNEVPANDPILEFVLINAAALFVVSGICESDTSDMGDGDDGKVIQERGPGGQRWKEGVRRARWALSSGEAWEKRSKVSSKYVERCKNRAAMLEIRLQATSSVSMTRTDDNEGSGRK